MLADLYQRRGDVEIGLPALTTMRNSKTRQRGIYGDIGKPRNRKPSLTRFEVARFRTAEDQAGENTGAYHNPTRERGISLNTV